MTGFGVDIGQLGSLTGKVSDIGDTLGTAAGSIGEATGGDFGHPQLNDAITRASGLFGDYLSGLSRQVGGMVGNLQSTMRSYSGSDDMNAQALAGIAQGAEGAPGGLGDAGPGGGSGVGYAAPDISSDIYQGGASVEPIGDFHDAAAGAFEGFGGSADGSSGNSGTSSSPFVSYPGNAGADQSGPGTGDSGGSFGLGNNPFME